MNIWLDAQLQPTLAPWMGVVFGLNAIAVRDLGLRGAKDFAIFTAARKADAVVLTKDADFVHLLAQHGPPPKVIWLRCGNTTKERLQQILNEALPSALKMLASGESMIEIRGT